MESPMIFALVLVFTILVLDIQDSDAWWWRKKTKSSRCNGGNPYYLGRHGFGVLKKLKRDAVSSRGTFTLKLWWIYYGGFYFERLSKRGYMEKFRSLHQSVDGGEKDAHQGTAS